MTLNPSWDDLDVTAAGRWQPPEPTWAERNVPAFLRSGETWVTLAISLIGFGAVIASIQSTNWVAEMPSLGVAGATGLLTGWLFAHIARRALWLHLMALSLGFAMAMAMTMQTMRLEDPLLKSGFAARWIELWERLGDWLNALVVGGISSDPLPFVLMLTFGLWLMGYLATWSIFRWHNAWLALMVGGFSLLTNISYLPGQPSGAFIVFLFAGILLVSRLHYLRRLRGWRAQQTQRSPYLSFEVLTFATWVGLTLILFAWIVPTANNWGPAADRWAEIVRPVSDRVDRLGRLFIGVGSKRDQHIHSFGEALPLQGAITLNPDQVLMSVRAPDLPSDRPLYLRGAVYDEYSSQGWTVSGAATLPLLGTSVEAARFGTPQTRAELRRPVEVQVDVISAVAGRRLFTAGDPITTDREARLLTDTSGFDSIGLVPAERVRDGDSYTTVGSVSGAALDTLLASGRDYPADIVQRYLQLPADLPPEVGQLAVEITGRVEQPYAAARQIEAYLREQYPFTLTVRTRPPQQDGVAFFLFDSQQGYFDHHASAMAVMLRTLGIPARVATGFVLDESDIDPQTKAYEVTELNAWAWPEVYFPGLGWVEFNPTPAERLISRPGDDADLLTAARRSDDESDELLTDAFLQELLADILIDDPAGTAAVIEESAIAAIIIAIITYLSVAAVFAVAVFIAIRSFWAYWFRGLEEAGARWAKLQQLASLAGAPMRANRTPIESAWRLEWLVGEEVDLTALAGAYSRERYGEAGAEQVLDEEAADQLRGSYIAARNRLLGRVLVRWLRFGRVPSPRGEVPAVV
jgi:transglutaminase-like putative cysteine protease